MSTQKRTVAIVGASRDRSKYGNKAVRAHVEEQWEVFPINPNDGVIEGVKAFRSLRDIPAPLTRVSMYLPPEIGIRLLPEIAAVNPEEFFLNPGSESDELVAEARKLGLKPIMACSIVNIGHSPGEFTP